jgi:dihydrofolate synthase/folylpolyglutamate synthase
LIAAIGRAAGYRVGLYTSPHLERPEERLRLMGRAIASTALAELLDEVCAVNRSLTGSPPSYFEALTAAALLWYRRREIDLAVLEVGLGGRLDATNVCQPLLSVIAPIDFDHEEHLGHTLPAIAREKAGIMRPRVPVLIWGEGSAATLRQHAAEVGAPLSDAAAETTVTLLEPPTAPHWRCRVRTPAQIIEVRCPLVGEHQARNLALGLWAAELLCGLGFERIDRSALAAGVAQWRWPGRLEEIRTNGPTFLLDGAHNPSGARVLAQHLRQRGMRHREVNATKTEVELLAANSVAAPQSPPQVDLLFGCLRNKNAAAMLAELVPGVRRVVVTRSRAGKTVEPEELLRLARAAGGREVIAAQELGTALEEVLREPAPLVVVAGSLYLQGELRPLLRQRYGVPAPVRDEVI